MRAAKISFLRRLLVCASGLLIFPFLAGPLSAQVDPGQSQDRSQLLRTPAGLRSDSNVSASGEDQGYAAASPNDPDLGEQRILKRVEEYQPFTITVSAPFYYTSNVALARDGEEDDVLVAPAFYINYQPRFTKTFYGEFALQQQFFYYDRFDNFNFGSFDAIAGVVYYLPQFHNLTLRAHYDFNRLTTDDDLGDEFFSDHALFFSAEIPLRFGRAQQLSLGTDVTFSLASDPSGPGRNDYEFYAGYTANLSRSFSLSAVGRLAIRDYNDTDRTDVSEIFALSANYRIRDWLTVSAISSVAWNQSNHDVFEYFVGNIGAGVGVTVKF